MEEVELRPVALEHSLERTDTADANGTGQASFGFSSRGQGRGRRLNSNPRPFTLCVNPGFGINVWSTVYHSCASQVPVRRVLSAKIGFFSQIVQPCLVR